MRRLLGIALLALTLAPVAAAATRQPVFGLRAAGNPKLGYFVYPLKPGAVQKGAVIVSNSGGAAGTVKLFTTDATTGATTGTVYLTARKPRRTGAWIALASKSLFLKPGQHRQVSFTVHAPASVKPGQWVGGIVAETSHRVTGPKSKQKASVQIKIRDLTIVAVQVNVPGSQTNTFTIGRVTTGGQPGFEQLLTHMSNDGNVLVKPTGRVTVLDSHGKTLQRLTFKMDTFLPQTAIDYPVLLKRALAPGDYTADVRLKVPAAGSAPARTFSARPTFSVSKEGVAKVFTSAAPQQAPPGTVASNSSSSSTWIIVAVIAGVLVLLVVAWLLPRRRQGGASAPPAAAPAPAPVAPAPEPEPAAEASPDEPAAAPEPTAERADHEHLWDVAYDRGELGPDGVWRFPHRCRICGRQVVASDVTDAASRAGAPT
jgi:WxL interacting protein linking bacterial and host surfaces